MQNLPVQEPGSVPDKAAGSVFENGLYKQGGMMNCVS